MQTKKLNLCPIFVFYDKVLFFVERYKHRPRLVDSILLAILSLIILKKCKIRITKYSNELFDVMSVLYDKVYFLNGYAK